MKKLNFKKMFFITLILTFVSCVILAGCENTAGGDGGTSRPPTQTPTNNGPQTNNPTGNGPTPSPPQ